MQLIQTILPLILASTLCSAVPVARVKRSAATMLSDIDTIDSEVAALSADVSSYTGNSSLSIAMATTVGSLESDLNTAAKDATAGGPFTAADSDSILAAVTTLTPNIVDLLIDLEGKALVFASIGFTATVASSLTKLNAETDAMFAALEASLDATDAASVKALQASVDTAFDTAMAIY